MRRFITNVVLSALLAPVVFAGGSVYTRYGFGDLLFFGGNRSFALGGTGIGLVSGDFINRLNPASLSKITLTRFSGSFYFNSISSKAPEGSSSYSNFGLQGIAVAIPISKDHGIVLGVESTPLSLVSYAVVRTQDTLGIASTQNVYGSGGLSQFALALSYSPTRFVHTGARLNYVFGRLHQYTKLSFTDPSFSNATNDFSVYYSGVSLTLGVMLERVGEHLGISGLDKLDAGFILTTPADLKANRQNSYITDSVLTITTKSTSTIPAVLGFGVSYPLNQRLLLTSDVVLQSWSGATFEGATQAQLRNAFRVAVGAELLPQANGDSYWKRVAYRAGAGFHQTYYQMNGTGIDEFFFSGGLGLPLLLEGRLNIGVQVGMRGTTAQRLEKETFVRLSVGISGTEAWFMKFDED
ncbi:MAG: hypothetical protein HY966_01535 [Ignavibacteriales bacterium]|nr:hypothetical protein [Ignavibacteriales bacterium]